MSNISRRSFFEGTAAGAALLTGVSAVQAQPQKAAEPKWDMETEVLVVGGGYGGLPAAVKAARLGKKAIVIDKRFWLGGDGLMSMGIFYSYKNRFHEAAGIKEELTLDQYFARITSGEADEPMSKVRDNQKLSVIYDGIFKHDPKVLYAASKVLPETIDLLDGYGVKFKPFNSANYFQFPTLPGSMSIFVKGMVDELAAKNVPIIKGLRATEIIMDGERVAGIRAEYVSGAKKGTEVRIKARSVIIGTGGFVNNKEMMVHYKRYWSTVDIGFDGLGSGMAMDHTGDGILMGRDIGAALEDMESMPKFYNGTYDKSPSISWIMFDVDTAYFIAPNGRRMLNEFESRYTGCLLALMQKGIKEGGRILFDEATFRSNNRDRWSLDKVMAAGNIFKADTPEELARLAGLDPQALKETIERINEDARNGRDTEFGRKDPLFRELKAPYYITKPNYPFCYKTEGGLEVNPDFQVLRAKDLKPIPGLFAVGAACGSISAHMCDAVAAGLIAGEKA
ncbi:FAD-binding protein [Sutterella sp.]|uniref:FAD-dependent oxidoreductase n=1 Tax=Sutterella sp. TaxID=1981025 RepID=UPI0026DEF514|nr:FAD-binding protein [Sutterella sp.]MDO5531689.1 FAD-binding protein [Sutterella sp.]